MSIACSVKEDFIGLTQKLEPVSVDFSARLFWLPQKTMAVVVLDGVNISYPLEFSKYTKRKIIGQRDAVVKENLHTTKFTSFYA